MPLHNLSVRIKGVDEVNEELNKRIQDFLDSFELVFHVDWCHTQSSIADELFIAENGTFLNPYPGQHFTDDNWVNHSSLLAAYRELKAFAISEGIYVQTLRLGTATVNKV